MAKISRRAFLSGLAAAGVLTACSANGGGGGEGEAAPPDPRPAPDLGGDPFTLGVASGDPRADSVILWTRLALDPLAADGGMPDEEVDLVWEVAADDAFDDVLATGVATATPALGHSVHVDVGGLEPDTFYSYRFLLGEQTSGAGMTRTLPAADAQPDQLRFAFASCQQWGDGYYTAWRYAAEDPLDLVVHLGDYIYENGAEEGEVRQAPVGEAFDLAGYRQLYGLYRSDEDLQQVHRQFPFVFTWDDHEVDNDYADDQQEDAEQTPAEFLERRAAAYQAWYENQPVRIPPPDGPDLEIYQVLDFGRLARFYLLDTRQNRDDQPCAPAGGPSQGVACGEEDDPARTILGAEQEAWLEEQLAETEATWNVFGSSVMVTPLPFTEGDPRAYNFDQWDGFQAARQRFVDAVVDNDVQNPVVICGDVHWSQVSAIPEDASDPSSPLAMTELVGTSISSSPNPEQAAALDVILPSIDNVEWANAAQRGYVRVTVTPDDLVAEYRLLVTALEPESEIEDTVWRIEAGTPGAVEV